jgi:uncharacterized membrane protein
MKNEDDAEFCKKCGSLLSGEKKRRENDDDCVCSGNTQNPLTPVFWGIVIILIGLWIVMTYIIPGSYLPMGLNGFSFWGLIILIIAIAFILTGFRKITKR